VTGILARLMFALCVILAVGVGAAIAIGDTNRSLMIAFHANDEAQETALYVLDVEHQVRTRLVASSYAPSSMDWSQDGTMAFTSLRYSDIFVLDENGIRNLTNTPEVSEYPFVAWSPDGRYLASSVTVSTSMPLQVYVIEYANPSRSINISNNEVRNAFAAWSPDGQLLAFNSFMGRNHTPISSLNVVNRASGQFLLSDISVRNLASVTWSPDSTHVAFVGEYRFEHGFYLLDIATGDISEIAIPLDELTSARWSSQTAWFALERYNRATEKNEVYLFNLQTNELQLLSDASQDSRNPRWSLDARWLVFDSWVGTNFDLYLMDMETGELRNVTQSAVGESAPILVP
jgi:Tol biopolymer transport system component